MSNLATQARAIARIARRVSPAAKTVRLESSDQGEFLSPASPFVIDADGTEHDADEHALDALFDPCGDISWEQAANHEALPGWTAVDADRGHYELDVATILGFVPDYASSALAQLLGYVSSMVAELPSEPPILMVDEDDLDYQGYDEETGEGIGTPHIRSFSAHCPRCGGQDLAELDWAVRRNRLEDWGFGDAPGSHADVFAGVDGQDSHFDTLTFCCLNCGQVIDMHSEDLDVETVWP